MSGTPPITHIVKRNGSTVQYNRERIATAILKAARAAGRPDTRVADEMTAKVEEALCATYPANHLPSVEDIQDVVENVLMENRLTDIARNYIIYRHQRAMVRAARAHDLEVTDNIPYKTLYEVLRWNMEHGCDSVEALNRTIETGRFPQLVQAGEERFNDEVRRAAMKIAGAREHIRIVIVAGPSSSGKTTTTLKLSRHLEQAGARLKTINIDHYFFDLEKHPRDEFGDYDYESPEALDLPLINAHLEQLLAGRTIRTPHYDFKTGRRTLDAHAFSLAPGELLLIDSLHGLYDRMTDRVPARNKFRLYIETLGQLRAADGSFVRWADNRLLRRMVRDNAHRNLKPIETLTHWHYVRRSELEHIIPFIKRADFVVNSALPFELPILKPRLFPVIASAVNRYRDDPRRLDAHLRANRVHDLLRPMLAVEDDGCVPPDSLLREFIGGA